MDNNKKLKEALIKILEKKANGFYFSEEVYEYEKTQNKSKNSEKQISFLENSQNFNFYDRVEANSVSPCDKIEVSDEKEKNKDKSSSNLTLVKKKITTHYVPPDMFAIKTLLEIIGQEIDEKNIKNMSDEELIDLKNKLTGEIVNENCKDI